MPRPPDALTIALMGPGPKMRGAGPMQEEKSAPDSQVVAGDVLAAIKSNDASALVTAMRNLMDVIHAEKESEEEAQESE